MSLIETPVNHLSRLEVPAPERVNQARIRTYLFSLNSSIGFVRLDGSIKGLLPHFSRQSRKRRDQRHAKSAESYVEHTGACTHAIFFDFLDLSQYRLLLYRKSKNTFS